jgi:hypothetical protein
VPKGNDLMRTDHGRGSQTPHHLQTFPHSEGEKAPALRSGSGSREANFDKDVDSGITFRARIKTECNSKKQVSRLGCVWVGLGSS